MSNEAFVCRPSTLGVVSLRSCLDDFPEEPNRKKIHTRKENEKNKLSEFFVTNKKQDWVVEEKQWIIDQRDPCFHLFGLV